MPFARPGDSDNAAQILDALGEEITLADSSTIKAIVIEGETTWRDISLTGSLPELMLTVALTHKGTFAPKQEFTYADHRWTAQEFDYDVKGWVQVRSSRCGPHS